MEIDINIMTNYDLYKEELIKKVVALNLGLYEGKYVNCCKSRCESGLCDFAHLGNRDLCYEAMVKHLNTPVDMEAKDILGMLFDIIAPEDSNNENK